MGFDKEGEQTPDSRRALVRLREGTPADISVVERFLFEHGPNQWNHLPEDEVRAHVAGIVTGDTMAILAESDGIVVGVTTYEIGSFYPQYQPQGRKDSEHGYLSEVVTHSKYAGRGVGTRMISEAIERLAARGIKEVYAKRHADNGPSGRMMEKAGMVVVDEFDDPEIRLTGSRKTSVTRIIR